MSIINIDIPYIKVDINNTTSLQNCVSILREKYYSTFVDLINNEALKIKANLDQKGLERVITVIFHMIALEFYKYNSSCNFVINKLIPPQLHLKLNNYSCIETIKL